MKTPIQADDLSGLLPVIRHYVEGIQACKCDSTSRFKVDVSCAADSPSGQVEESDPGLSGGSCSM